jgi:hypothetical protein
VSRRKNKEHITAAQSSITALNLEVPVKLLQAFKEKSQNEDVQLNEQLQKRHENEQVLHKRNVDLQRKDDDLNRDFRKARVEHQRELERQSRELERDYRMKISKRDAIQQAERQQHEHELQQQPNSLQALDNSPMAPATMTHTSNECIPNCRAAPHWAP